jgi:hypothetical protein
MKLKVAFDNFAKFFDDDEKLGVEIPAEIFRDETGKLTEIRIYNVEYEEVITLNRSGQVEALSVEEYEKAVKFK